jgi:hypothetical protein
MTRSEFEAMTKDELVAYADDRDIEVQHNWLKDEIITEIMKAEKKAAKEEAKEETKHETGHGTGFPVASAGQQVDPETGVSPELAELQRQANQPVDDSTRFAAKHTFEE